MPATVYSFEDMTPKRARLPRSIDSHGHDQFACELERLLSRLSDLHLRISLVRLPLGGHATRGTAATVVDNLRDPCALAGMMPDASVVAAFLGPRGSRGAVGDDEMTARILRRFERALGAAPAARATALSGLTVAHCWSDEVFDVPSLVLDLVSARPNAALGDHDVPARCRPA
jgi:hypothetical protein